MSRRRRTPATEVDSLELGLDMVCNSFGVIIFITLMTVIIPTGVPEETKTSGDPTPSQLIDRSDLLAQVDAVQASVDSMDTTVRTITVQDTTATQRAQLQDKIHAAQDALDNLQKSTDDLRHTLEREQRLLEQRRQADHALQVMTAQLVTQSPTAINERRLPALHVLPKGRYFIFLKYNRVYLPQVITPSGWLPNDVDLDLVKKPGDRKVFTPREGQGEDYHAFLAASRSLRLIYDKVAPENCIIDICVYPDSIGAFDEIKATFAARGYDYNWDAVGENEKIELRPDPSHRAEGM